MSKDYKYYGHTITDIVSVGTVSKEDTIIKYYPDFRMLYIEVDNVYIKFSSVEQYSRLQVEFVDKVDYSFEIDEDMEYAMSSLLDIVLVGRDMIGNDINQILYYDKEEKDNILCKACEIRLANGQIIFLDPSFLCGISIGGIAQKEYYMECNSSK